MTSSKLPRTVFLI